VGEVAREIGIKFGGRKSVELIPVGPIVTDTQPLRRCKILTSGLLMRDSYLGVDPAPPAGCDVSTPVPIAKAVTRAVRSESGAVEREHHSVGVAVFEVNNALVIRYGAAVVYLSLCALPARRKGPLVGELKRWGNRCFLGYRPV